MNRGIQLLAGGVLAVSLTGCVVVADGDWDWDHEDWRQEQQENREYINSLDMGMARTDVMDRMGTPDMSEAFTRDGHEYRILFYRTQHRKADGETTRDETTPLIFEDDSLIGWGNEVLASLR